MMRFLYFALAVCSLSSPVLAQGAMLELYGEGVHRYYSGDILGAQELFLRVTSTGTDDPRPHYYLGLVRECTGGDGTADFEYGAQLEATGKNSVAVGQALTRVQGHVRAKIEKARRDARVAALQQRMALEAARASAAPAVNPDPANVAPAAPDVTDSPFDEGMRSDATTEDATQPTTPEVDASNDPFTDDPAPPATEPAPADAPAGNPFGGDDSGSSDATNPFGGAGDAGDAGAGNPFGGDSGSGDAGGNPFGGDAGGNPFGGDTSGGDNAGGNPFGN